MLCATSHPQHQIKLKSNSNQIHICSSQFGMGGPQVVHINEVMIRGLFGNTAVILLFVLPTITMRSYAEEKRPGTMELLLKAPLSDLQIIFGKVLGAMALYVLMLAMTHI